MCLVAFGETVKDGAAAVKVGNYLRALEIFRGLADHGNANAMYGLGLLATRKEKVFLRMLLKPRIGSAKLQRRDTLQLSSFSA